MSRPVSAPGPYPLGHTSAERQLEALSGELVHCMAADRHRLSLELRRVREQAARRQDVSAALSRLGAAVARSRARCEERRARLPQPEFPPELPVSEKRADIARAIQQHQVVIVCGETGSGKTTQLPKICLDLQRGAAGMIGHTQPRRIAARTVAARIAQELKSPLGQAVGYKVRFTDKVSEASAIKLMTDGILLAETQGDRFLTAYDTLIVDEAHERSLNIDFLLGYLCQLLPRRRDLKLIITSATLDAERFSRHFGGAPVVDVSGRLYPVEVRYRPWREAEREDAGNDSDGDVTGAILDAVDELYRIGPGDTLVFLPGEREIRETAEALRKHHPPGTEILPLYARLSAAEQERVFAPSRGRRIVLATNVAETSLTVPGIRYVVDPGLARVNRYSYRNKVEQLVTEAVSQASANQRAGRCGRVMSGVCVRLYSEEDFQARPPFSDPEILRSSLASVILRMQALNLGEVERFPFIDPPQGRMIADGYQLLAELGAVDEARRISAVGRDLARLPIDPRIGRMVLAARQEQCLTEILVIASALSVQDPRERPLERQQAADQAHSPFNDERSDFTAYLKIWDFFEAALRHKKSNRKLREQCQQHFLSPTRMREWRDVHGQLHALATEMGFSCNPAPASHEQIHRALLTGLLGNIGTKGEEPGEYQGARGIRFHIHPGSGLRKKSPGWLMAAELTQTTRLYARCVAAIEPEWVERVAPHLVKRHYFEPHWEKSGARVVAFEQVSLYGLILCGRRRVHYGPIDPKLSRELFIRGALVHEEYDTRAGFFRHKQRLRKEIEDLEHKSRRLDVLVDEERVFAFFDRRLPQGIYNGAGFENWRQDAERENPGLLFMARDDLMRHEAEGVTGALYPETLELNGIALKLAYRFEPGHALDGVTVSVPLHLLNQLPAARFDWLVPGLLREKVNALIRALPKPLRRACVPVPECVTECLTELEHFPGERPLAEALSAALKKRRGVDVPLQAWDTAQLPAHLKFNFRVVDEQGAEVAMDRDLGALREKLGGQARQTFGVARPGIEREGLTGWDFDELPQELSFSRHERALTGYPALLDEGASVSIRLFDTRAAADTALRAGVRRLLRLELKEQMKQLEKTLPGFNQAALQLRAIAGADELKEDLVTAIADRAFIGEDPLPRSRQAFEAQKQRARARLPAVTEAACRLLNSVAEEHQRVSQRLAGAGPALSRVAQDIRGQLAQLIYKGFLGATPWDRLQHLPRYLKAMLLRMDKYPNNPERDARHGPQIAELWKRYEQKLERNRKEGVEDARLEEFRWMLEELRVSLFAQELKTPYPVSAKRLEKRLGEIDQARPAPGKNRPDRGAV